MKTLPLEVAVRYLKARPSRLVSSVSMLSIVGIAVSSSIAPPLGALNRCMQESSRPSKRRESTRCGVGGGVFRVARHIGMQPDLRFILSSARAVLVRIDTKRIRDWASFHDVFAEALGFPDFYGRNMVAWNVRTGTAGLTCCVTARRSEAPPLAASTR